MRRLALVLPLLVALVACSGGNRHSPSHPSVSGFVPNADQPLPISDELLDHLALFATEAPRDRKVHPRVDDDAALAAYIAALVDDSRFARTVAPHMLMRAVLQRAGSKDLYKVLSVDESGREPVLYFNEKCDPALAESVHPWWAMDTTVKVCPSAHRPERRFDPRTGTYCGSPPRKPDCGCGPNLAFCVKDEKQKAQIITSLQDEMRSIIARTVASNRPLEDAYLTNETERDRNTEYVYRRWRISAGESPAILEDLARWPETPVLAPRAESIQGQHAGLLTAAGALGVETGRRARMKWFYNVLWCDEPPGGTVSTESVLALAKPSLRDGDGWELLAKKPICTDCHARLDYGSQFFTGYTYTFAYDSKEHSGGTGKLYSRNIGDYRGEGELTPKGFAQLAVAQPEFSACVVLDVKRHVFDDAWDSTHDAALEAAFAKRRSLKDLMRQALTAYAAKARSGEASSRDTGQRPSLAQMLEEHCSSCHGGQRQPPDLAAPSLATLRKALVQVAFGTMPKHPASMTTVERQRMTELLILASFSDDAAQTQARRYFAAMRPLPVHSVEGMLNNVSTRAGRETAPDIFLPTPERSTRADLVRYSPNVAALVHFRALEACTAAGRTDGTLERCIEDAAAISGIVRH